MVLLSTCQLSRNSVPHGAHGSCKCIQTVGGFALRLPCNLHAGWKLLSRASAALVPQFMVILAFQCCVHLKCSSPTFSDSLPRGSLSHSPLNATSASVVRLIGASLAPVEGRLRCGRCAALSSLRSSPAHTSHSSYNFRYQVDTRSVT